MEDILKDMLMKKIKEELEKKKLKEIEEKSRKSVRWNDEDISIEGEALQP